MEDIKVLLGERIRELRKLLNISQQELAEKINIDQRNLSNIECGISFPSKTLIQISKALNVTLMELFDFEHHKLSPKDMKKFIIDYLENISQDNLKIVYRLIKSMK